MSDAIVRDKAAIEAAKFARSEQELQPLLAYLKNNKDNINSPCEDQGLETLLHLAVSNRNIKAIKMLLANGANMHKPGNGGFSALMAAARSEIKDPKIVSILLESAPERVFQQSELENKNENNPSTTNDIVDRILAKHNKAAREKLKNFKIKSIFSTWNSEDSIKIKYDSENRNFIPKVNTLFSFSKSKKPPELSATRKEQLARLFKAIEAMTSGEKISQNKLLDVFKVIGTLEAELNKEHNLLGSKLKKMLVSLEKDLIKAIGFFGDIPTTAIKDAKKEGADSKKSARKKTSS